MGRRDPDPRPPIEIVGTEPVAGSLQRVTTGPHGPRRAGRRVLAVVAMASVVLLVGLALDTGGDDADPTPQPAEERDNSAKLPLKASTTTTVSSTTTTIPVGPVLGESVGGAGLLVYTETGWLLVDLDTGHRMEADLPILNPYAVMPVRGGVVVADPDASRLVALYSIGHGGDVGEARSVGLADQVLSAGRPDRLWLIDGGGRVNEGGGLLNEIAVVRQVDGSGEVLRSFEVATHVVSEGLEEGLVFDRGGRVYLADERGVRPIAVGSSVGVIGADLLVLSCDDDADCAVVRQPVDGRAARVLFDVADAENLGFDSSTSADGAVALTTYGASQSLRLFAADGTALGALDDAVPLDGPPSWLPDDLGLLAPARQGVQWIHDDGDRWVSTPVPGLSDLGARVVVVIDW